MKKDIPIALAWVGGTLLLVLVTKFAHQYGYMSHDTVLRIVIGANGLMVAYYGNRIPKAVAPSAAVRQVMRVSGWAQVLSGLAYTALWAFAPIPVAALVGTAAIAAGFIVTISYCFWLRSMTKPAH